MLPRILLIPATVALLAGCGGAGAPAVQNAAAATAGSGRAHVTEKVLYNFTGGSDGGGPNGSITFDTSGKAYGTTHFGGISSCGGNVGGGCGVVFELSPNGSGGWSETPLYAFADGSDGGFPNAGVILDPSGNIYGSASTGGNFQCSIGCGVVYELIKSSGWSESIVHTFDGNDGEFPNALLLANTNGTMESTTWYGGSTGNGTVFSLTRNGSSWTENVLYNFKGTTDGSAPAAGLFEDRMGNLYGTTYKYDGNNDGVVFQLKDRRRQYTHETLYSFGAGSGGEDPYAGVIMPVRGKLFGTTIEAGSLGGGTAFELLRSKNNQWTQTPLHEFGGTGDGSTPYGGLIADKAGNLYGTTLFGGKNNAGTVYELSSMRGQWKERILYAFTGGTDGGNPGGTLTMDSAGNLYGTAGGGQSGNGVIFEVTVSR
jgi:uncharacterized repeat protein (TIGR03803 family)